MKNKKGISFGRIILYVLFITLIALFIYTLFITYKAMKKKKIEDNSVNSSLRMVDNNFNYSFSAVDDISNIYMKFYSNSLYSSISGDSATFRYNPFSEGVYCLNQVGNNVILPISATDNVINVGDSYSTFYNYAYDEYNYPPNYLDRFESNNQCAIMFDCNILVSNFIIDSINFTNMPTSGRNYFRLFYKTNLNDNVFSTRVFYGNSSSSSDVNYSLSQHIDSSVSNASYITGFGFLFWSSDRNNIDGIATSLYDMSYPPSTYSFNLGFQLLERDSSYQQGYENGFNDGVSQVNDSLQNGLIEANSTINDLNTQLQTLQIRADNQQYIITQLQNQLNNSNQGFKGLFFTMADVPFRTVSNALGFDFWGVNLFRFFVGVITALGILWLIKRLYK